MRPQGKLDLNGLILRPLLLVQGVNAAVIILLGPLLLVPNGSKPLDPVIPMRATIVVSWVIGARIAP